MNSPSSTFNETDQSRGVDTPTGGIVGVYTTTKRGPLGRPDILITSWPQFERIYGGLILGKQGPTLAKRALERGASLRVVRAAHYTNIADSTTYDPDFAVVSNLYKITLSAALAAGHSITATNGALTITQNFTVSGIATLNAFAAQLRLQPWIADVKVIDSTHINVGSAAVANTVFSTAGAGAPVLTTVVAAEVRLAGGVQPLFNFTPKNPGTDANNLVVYVEPPSNGRTTDSFNVRITHKLEPSLNEIYTNLRIVGKPTVAQSTYLADIQRNSQLANPLYFDLSAIAGAQLIPDTATILGFQGGGEGAAMVASDYIGDAGGKTGSYAFDGIDDVGAIAILDDIAGFAGVIEAWSAYADTRKDLDFFAHLDGISEQAVATARNALVIDSSFTRFFSGYVKQINLLTNQEETISELGDALGIAAYSWDKFGPYKSFAGKNRGIIINTLGSGNKWGSRGNKKNLDILAQAQVNPVIDRDGQTYLLSNFTAQQFSSLLSFGNVRDLIVYAKKALAPTVERYQEEPNEPTSWKKLYLEVKPFLDDLKAQRAVYDYRWEGDQFAKEDLSDLKINTAADLNLGKYRARFFIKPIPTMNEIAIDIVITPSSVSFEDALTLIQQP